MNSSLPYLTITIACFLLILPVRPALNAAADAAIQQAIIAAVNDGLKVIDTTYRATYWAYLQNA